MVDCFASFTDPSDPGPVVYPGDTIVIPGNGIVDEYDEDVTATTDGACGVGAVTLTINNAVAGRNYEVSLSGSGTLVKLSDTVWCWTPPSDEDERDNSTVDVKINGNTLYTYVPHFCCKSGLYISGPATVEPDSETEYSLAGAPTNCNYNWYSTDGWIVEGTFQAPSESGIITLSVKPFMGDDSAETCATKEVLVDLPCGGESIGYTTLQMDTSGTQTLTVVDPVVGKTYGWTTTSGSLSAATGLSVVFTASATNPNCANNPTITLTCGGAQVDSISIAINAINGKKVGYVTEVVDVGWCRIRYYPPGVISSYVWNGMKVKCYALQCNGTVTLSDSNDYIVGLSDCTQDQSCSCAKAYEGAVQHTGICECVGFDAILGKWSDCRSAAQKAAGCCPEQLMSNTRTCPVCY